MNTCETCHWHFHGIPEAPEWGLCVFLSGSHGETVCGIQAARYDKALRHCSFRTRPTFGCNHWEKDERKQEATNG